MIAIENNFKDLVKYIDKLEKDLDRIVEVETKKLGLKILAEIKIEWPDDTTQSRSQITLQQTRDGVIIFARAEYSKYIDNIDPNIEYVRRPGGKLPPLDVIEAWAKRKGILSGGDNTDESDIVYLIARKIARDGVKNMKIFYTVREENRGYVQKVIYPKISKIFK